MAYEVEFRQYRNPSPNEWSGNRVPHILVAEDDPVLRERIASDFAQAGCEVTECVDGADLVFEIRQLALFGPPAGFDLVVSDVAGSKSIALETLGALRDCAIDGVPPVILLTASAEQGTRRIARELGVSAVLERPFELHDLVSTARRILTDTFEGML